jgi:uncharacterized protein with FMN-binding domain
MILGIITTILLLLTFAKFITKRLKFKKADKLFAKSHKITGIMLIIVALLHLITSFSLFETRPLVVYVLGVIALVCMLVVAGSYFFRKSLGTRWIKIHWCGSVVILVVIALHIFMVINSLTEYKNAINNISFDDIKISDVSDGQYEGECDAGYIYARVRVTVQLGSITNIELIEHQNERGTPAEAITNKMVEEQKVDVDAISGATNSSKVIKKAVENALLEGIHYAN